MKIGIIVGTRPEIIKMSPIIKYCEDNNIAHDIIHTQQHYSINMDKIIFDNLELAYPELNLVVRS
jgi:UDP-N-acetylglucosamine 2-epimerase (non-hydrolysing)